jgi:hypothetical protein
MASRAVVPSPSPATLEAVLVELAVLRRRVAALERMARTRATAPDHRLGPVLAMIYRFAHAAYWSASEMLHDAKRGDRELWCELDAIVGGDRGYASIRFGRWLERHERVDVDGLRLVRAKREAGAWLYCVQPVE